MKHYTITISDGQKWAFVLDPALKGRYVRTHRCVHYVACPRCKAKRHGACMTADKAVKAQVCYSRLERFWEAVKLEVSTEKARGQAS